MLVISPNVLLIVLPKEWRDKMKGSKETRNWVNQRRKQSGKKNGVVPWLWDAPDVERMDANNKRRYKRNKIVKPSEE